MADQDMYAKVKEFFENMFSNQGVAAQVAVDPQGALDAHGITEYDQEMFQQAVGETYQAYDLPYGNQEVLHSYAQGAPPPANYPVQPPMHAAGGQAAGTSAGAAEAAQHVQYVTYAAYEQHPEIRQEISNNLEVVSIDQSDNRQFEVDNSVNLDGVNVEGDLDLDVENANALGDEANAVAGGGEITNVDGDGNLVGDENALNLGDGDQLIASRGGEIDAVTGDEAFVAEDISGQVNTGTFTGVQAGGDVENPVVGDGNQTANLEFDTGGGDGGAGTGGTGGDGGAGGFFGGTGGDGGSADGSGGNGGDGGDIGPINLGFGSGDQTTVAESELDVDDGSALSLDGDATGIADSFNTDVAIEQIEDEPQEILVTPAVEPPEQLGDDAGEEIPVA